MPREGGCAVIGQGPLIAVVSNGGHGNDWLGGGSDGQRDKLYCGEGKDYYRADKHDYVSSSCEKKVRFEQSAIHELPKARALGRSLQASPLSPSHPHWSTLCVLCKPRHRESTLRYRCRWPCRWQRHRGLLCRGSGPRRPTRRRTRKCSPLASAARGRSGSSSSLRSPCVRRASSHWSCRRSAGAQRDRTRSSSPPSSGQAARSRCP